MDVIISTDHYLSLALDTDINIRKTPVGSDYRSI